MCKISLIASSVRPHLYEGFFNSMYNEEIGCEVVFAGNNPPEKEWPQLRYIKTGNIKPAQCYEIARREARGELICWVADDCEFKGNILTLAYDYWEFKDNPKLIISLQTKEADAHKGDMHLVPMKVHSFRGKDPTTPLMAPIGMMSREWCEEIGGFDKRFVCGQWENDLVMRAYHFGGTVEIFGNLHHYVEIDHKKKHGGKRPFETGYGHDRKILEGIWGGRGEKDVYDFQPYINKDLLTKSQSHKGGWE